MAGIIHPLPRIEIGPLEEVVERRWVALVTSEPDWAALEGRLRLSEVWRAEPTSASLGTFEALAAAVPSDAEVVYAVGGRLSVDAAKLTAARRGLPLVAVPTALSVDAHLSPTSAVRRGGAVARVETGPPERLLVDWEVIAAAPAWLRAAGVCDVLSLVTATWDWHFAQGEGENPPDQEVLAYAVGVAEALSYEATLVAAAAGAGKPAGLDRLLRLLALQVQVCNHLGHTRVAEGSEHYFAHAVETLLGPGIPHADLVGPGILAMAAAQGQDVETLRAALLAAGVRLDQIPRVIAERVLRGLRTYVRHHNLPFGIAHVLDDDRIDAALAACWDEGVVGR